MSKKKFEAAMDVQARLGEIELAQAEMDHAKELARHAGNFYLVGDITLESAAELVREMDTWVTAFREDYDTISLVINSEGGELAAGLFIHDALRAYSAIGLKVVTGVRGEACSMAAVVLQAGDCRMVGAASRIMLHQVSSGGAGSTREIRDQVEHLEDTDLALADLFAKRSGKFTAEWLEAEIRHRDRWFTPAQALEAGLVDHIA